jgi:sterol desaturase/sphingolipid hydroxylase (fatty acid hydroxylase superfamily)
VTSHIGLPYAVFRGAALATGCFAVFAVLERRAGASMARYTTRHFLMDLLYRLVTIVYMAVLWTPLVGAFRSAYPRLDLGFVNHAPLWLALPASWVILDFLGYWVHRLQHSRYWWPFHRLHHSQEHVTFATTFRNHPLDQLGAYTVTLVPGLLIGIPVLAWVPFTVMMELYAASHHANLPWRFGWLRRIFVSPVFHQAHHSTNPEIHHGNYGGLFSTWDFLFGTAFDADALPERTGVEGWVVPESLWPHLLSPFRAGSVMPGSGKRDAELTSPGGQGHEPPRFERPGTP